MVDSIRGLGLDPGEPPWPPPLDVKRIQVCTASGDLPNAYCKDRSLTWFIPGKSPIRVSNLHRLVKVDRHSGRVTCDDGPDVREEVYEFWPSDLQRLFAEAGLPRRKPPGWIDCGATEAVRNDGPVISSPNADTTYTLRLSRPVPIALRASAVAADETLFWFAGDGWIGKSTPREALPWNPDRPGFYQLHVIDQEGRSDSRAVTVEVVP
jgi:penicillin-binding protein 1C